MTGHKMSLDDFRAYVKALPRALESAAVRGLHAGGERAVGVLVRAGDKAAPASDHGATGARDTGRYRQGWKSEPLPDGVVVVNRAPYADVIEEGRRPGRKPPPSRAIARWAQRRLDLDEAEARRASFAIARAIGRRGLRGRHVLGGQVPAIVKIMIAEMRREIGQALRRGR